MAIFGRRARPDETTGLADRVRALAEAAEACQGRVPAEVITEAERVAHQVDRRLAFSGSSTVVALAGATGSGKSSLFNALSGTDLARVGVTRPTTSEPLAVTWGDEPTEDLLDWLQVPRRHALPPGTRSPRAPGHGQPLDGLVLLDLPDHDSTEKSNQLQVDRLVQLVDVMVWVVDPQKYADAVLHERYLRPLVEHAPVMVVVLNQIDRLPPAEREACLRDLRRLLDSEGLEKTTIRAVSAETGEGLPELRELIAARVADKLAAARRLAADVSTAADRLASASGDAQTPELTRRSLETMNTAMAEAAGARLVGDAVRDAWRVRGAAATGWPVVAWIGRLKPDPLRRLHLDRLSAGSKGAAEGDRPDRSRADLAADSLGRAAGTGRHRRPRSGGRGERGSDPRLDGRGEGGGPLAGVPAARRAGPGGGPDRSGRRPSAPLVAGRPGAAVDPARRGGRRAALAGGFLRARLPAAAAAAPGDLGAAAGTDRAGARRRAGRPAAGRSSAGSGSWWARRAASGRLGRLCVARSPPSPLSWWSQPVRAELDRYARARAALTRATARADPLPLDLLCAVFTELFQSFSLQKITCRTLSPRLA